MILADLTSITQLVGPPIFGFDQTLAFHRIQKIFHVTYLERQKGLKVQIQLLDIKFPPEISVRSYYIFTFESRFSSELWLPASPDEEPSDTESGSSSNKGTLQ